MNQKSVFKFFFNILLRIYQVFYSLKLAVVVILLLAVSLAVATILESLYDTSTAQFWVYRSTWFHGVLALLGVNIFCVAVSRYPWKKYHIPFLMAHVGILALLAGSWITEKAGIDGNMRVSEGEATSVVDLDHSLFVISDQDRVYSIPVPWVPPGVAFKTISAAKHKIPFDLKIDRFLSHADSTVSFVPTSPPDSSSVTLEETGVSNTALHLRLVGGAMGISQDFWLWEGAPTWNSVQMGPAKFSIGKLAQKNERDSSLKQPWMEFTPEKDGGLSYSAHSSEGKVVHGKFPKGKIEGRSINPGWKGNVTLVVEKWIPNANPFTSYSPSRIQYGNQAPSSAIHVVASEMADVWLGLGDRAVLHLEGKNVEIGYFPRRIMLPFSIRLNQFTVEHDPGTLSPAAYFSRVSVLDDKSPREVTIGMNEPLELGSFTLYQASYEDGVPRPVTSIFSVNRDPGRVWKYGGSLLIVLGSILLFAAKYRRSRASVLSYSEASL